MDSQQSPTPPYRRPADPSDATPFAVLTRLGEVLILQLLFVLASLPLVTIVPAAIALQRSLYEVLQQGSTRPAATFMRWLRWSLPRFWLIGLLVTLSLAVGVVAGLFWAGQAREVRWLGLGVLGGIGVTVLVGYLAVLSAVTSRTVDLSTASRRTVLEIAVQTVQRRPAQLAAAAVAVAGWQLLQLHVPTLILVGSGLVPAAITWFLVARPDAPGPTRARVRAPGRADRRPR